MSDDSRKAWEEFRREVGRLGLSLENTQMELLNGYYEGLLRLNERVNLTRILSLRDFLLKHYLDSALLWKLVNDSGSGTPKNYMDFGTGGGVPAFPLWLYLNRKPGLTLVDARNKKLLAVQKLILDLTGVEVNILHANWNSSRAKAFSKTEKFDLVTARAVGEVEMLIRTLSPVCSDTLILPRGPAFQDGDMGKVRKLAMTQGFRSCELIEFSIREFGEMDRKVLFLKKK